MKLLNEKELIDHLMNPNINGLLTSTPIKYDIHTFTTVPAICRTCEKTFGSIITKTETYFECSKCLEAIDD